VDVRGDDGFLKDVQSLLVATCIHELLPELQAKGLHDEHDLLVNLIARHLVIVWRNEPGQFFFLQGSLLEYLGNRDHAGAALEAAFRATPPDAHEYLTRAQAVWSYFIEEGRLGDAEELALRLVRSVREDDLAEATGLLRDTYGYVHRQASG
jgi:tetratricopeptide (TPR) repeat protein